MGRQLRCLRPDALRLEGRARGGRTEHSRVGALLGKCRQQRVRHRNRADRLWRPPEIIAAESIEDRKATPEQSREILVDLAPGPAAKDGAA